MLYIAGRQGETFSRTFYHNFLCWCIFSVGDGWSIYNSTSYWSCCDSLNKNRASQGCVLPSWLIIFPPPVPWQLWKSVIEFETCIIIFLDTTHGWFDTHVCTCTDYPEFSEADYFADQAGVYEIRQSTVKEFSRVMMQVHPVLILVLSSKRD